MLLYSLDGRCQATYSAYEMALGIKSVTWSSTSQFLAIGSYDEKVRYVCIMLCRERYLRITNVHFEDSENFSFCSLITVINKILHIDTNRNKINQSN